MLIATTFLTKYQYPFWKFNHKPIPNFNLFKVWHYSVTDLRIFADFLSTKIGIIHYDFLLKDFCKENNIKLYGTTLSLEKKIGKVSIGLGHHHTVINFLNDYIK
jgi:hypothetical protein